MPSRPTCLRVERVLRWFAPFQNLTGPAQGHHRVGADRLVGGVEQRHHRHLSPRSGRAGCVSSPRWPAWLEEKGSQRWAERLYNKAKAGFELFWDERRGSYVDHIVDGDAGTGDEPDRAARRPSCRDWRRRNAGAASSTTITDPAKLVIYTWQMGGGPLGQKPQAGAGMCRTQIVRAEPFMSYVVHDAVALAGKAEQSARVVSATGRNS